MDKQQIDRIRQYGCFTFFCSDETTIQQYTQFNKTANSNEGAV